MFETSLTTAQSNGSNEKLLFVKREDKSIDGKAIIYLLFYGENMLCPSSKLAVQLSMSTPVSKMADEGRDALPVSLLRL